MDIRQLIKKELYPIFLELNEYQRKHSEVWLSHHIYISGHVLYVRMWPGLRKTKEEEIMISEIIRRKIKPEFSNVITVRVLDLYAGINCSIKNDVMVYCDETAIYDYAKITSIFR